MSPSPIYLVVVMTALCQCIRLAIARQPCKEIQEGEVTLRKQTLVDLFKNPKSVLGYSSVRNCGIEYIDLKYIQPPAGSDWMWISFLGDSVMHDLFEASIQVAFLIFSVSIVLWGCFLLTLHIFASTHFMYPFTLRDVNS